MSRRGVIIGLGLFYVCISVGAASDLHTENQVRPEADLFLHPWERIRFELDSYFQGDPGAGDWQTRFAFYVETSLKPVLRRELRGHPDVYRNRYLSMRTGYQYRTGIDNPGAATGHTAILEVTSRFMVPWKLILSDRNRGDFRFLRGDPFSTRYRNRLRVERDFQSRKLHFTPYLFDEAYYDTRFDHWSTNRYAAGVELLVNDRVIVEPYYLRQHNTRSSPTHVSAAGLRVKLYFLRPR